MNESERMSDVEYAAWLDRHRDDLELVTDEVTDAEVSPGLSSVVSVRFPAGELESVERAAAAAGMRLSTYIRQAALAAADTVNIEEARRDLTHLRSAVDQLARHLGAA